MTERAPHQPAPLPLSALASNALQSQGVFYASALMEAIQRAQHLEQRTAALEGELKVCNGVIRHNTEIARASGAFLREVKAIAGHVRDCSFTKDPDKSWALDRFTKIADDLYAAINKYTDQPPTHPPDASDAAT